MASSGWDAPGSGGSGNTSFDSSATPTGTTTYGYSTDEANIPVYIGTGRKANVANVVGPVGPKSMEPKDVPVWQAVTAFESLPTDQLIAEQKRLYAGGFYKGLLDKGEVPKFGQADSDTIKAYTEAVRETVRRNGSSVGNGGNRSMTLDDVIDQGAATQSALGGDTKQETVTNPDQIKAVIQSVAPSILGKRAPDDVVNKILASFQSLENQQNSEDASGAPTVTAAPSGSAWFQEQLQQLMPNTYNANRIFQGLSGVQSAINGGQFANLVSH